MDESPTIEQVTTFRSKLVDYLSLERNVSLASAAVFILGLGEELWKKFLPKYLEALGASTAVIGGEPARKAMIVDFAQENVRARSVGLYYLVRSLSITPAALIGGLLWSIAPKLPFIVAGVIGLVGTFVFAVTVEEKYAS
jgi:hypothetical protein